MIHEQTVYLSSHVLLCELVLKAESHCPSGCVAIVVQRVLLENLYFSFWP